MRHIIDPEIQIEIVKEMSLAYSIYCGTHIRDKSSNISPVPHYLPYSECWIRIYSVLDALFWLAHFKYVGYKVNDDQFSKLVFDFDTYTAVRINALKFRRRRNRQYFKYKKMFLRHYWKRVLTEIIIPEYSDLFHLPVKFPLNNKELL